MASASRGWLPSFNPTEAAPSSSSPLAHLGKVRRGRVLVVDPDESARSVLQVALVRDGFDVVSVSSAEEALRQLSPPGPLPVSIIVEAALHGADGFAFCSQLRSNPRTATVPVLLLARHDEAYYRELASGAGADDYLPKPVFVRDVVTLVRLRTAPVTSDGGIVVPTDGLPLAQLLRALLGGVRSGHIEVEGGQGQLVFRGGRVVDAWYRDARGEEALMRALLLARGPCVIRFGPPLGQESLAYGLSELLARAFPRLLQWQVLAARSVPLEARLAVDFTQLVSMLGQLPDGLNPLVRLCDGHRTVREVVAESRLDELIALEAATRLYTLGVIVPVEEPAPALAPRPAPSFFEPLPPGVGQAAAAPLPVEGLTDWFHDIEQVIAQETAREPSETWTSAQRILGDAGADMGPLDPQLRRQVEAFNIQPVHEPAPAAPSPRDVRAFARGDAIDEERPLEEAIAAAPPIPLTAPVTPIPLTRPVTRPAAQPIGRIKLRRATEPGGAAEDRFFAEGEQKAERPGELPDESSAAPARRTTARAATVLFAALLLVAAVGVVVSSRSEPTRTTAADLTAARRAPPPPEAPPPSPLEMVSAEPAPPVPEPVTPAEQTALDEAIALYERGHAREAAERLERLVQERPGNSSAWVMLGLARFDSLDRAGAEAAAHRALDIDATNGRALMLLASVYLDGGERAKAEAVLQRYLANEPSGRFAAEARHLLSRM